MCIQHSWTITGQLNCIQLITAKCPYHNIILSQSSRLIYKCAYSWTISGQLNCIQLITAKCPYHNIILSQSSRLIYKCAYSWIISGQLNCIQLITAKCPYHNIILSQSSRLHKLKQNNTDNNNVIKDGDARCLPHYLWRPTTPTT